MQGLVLRDTSEYDLDALFKHQSDPDVIQMIGFPPSHDPYDRAGFMAKWEKLLVDDSVIKKTIFYHGKIAGFVVCFERDGVPEVGYALGKVFWGKGIASTALSLVLMEIAVRPLYGRTIADNMASQRVLIKSGFSILRYEKSFSTVRAKEVNEVVLILK